VCCCAIALPSRPTRCLTPMASFSFPPPAFCCLAQTFSFLKDRSPLWKIFSRLSPLSCLLNRSFFFLVTSTGSARPVTPCMPPPQLTLFFLSASHFAKCDLQTLPSPSGCTLLHRPFRRPHSFGSPTFRFFLRFILPYSFFFPL